MQKINILTKIKDSFEPLIPYEKIYLIAKANTLYIKI